MSARIPRLHDALATRKQEGLLRSRRIVTPLEKGRCRIDDKVLVNFATNDYLDLAGDPRVAAAAERVIADSGTGARASALICGRSEWHALLEERIAAFERTAAAVLFPTGYAANVGTIASLVAPADRVFCDRFNHASLVDGIRLSGAGMRVYRHDRLERLEQELRKSPEGHRRWIVTDAVFSMDGDLAPLPELCDLADRFDAMLIVDEAHGTGVFGEQGRGVCEAMNVEHRVGVRVGTLSKAVGCVGGFVAGDRDLTDWLWNTARTQMFSTAGPPAVCAAAAEALSIIEQEPERRTRLHRRADRLRTRLSDANIAAVPASQGPIVPVVVGESEPTMRIARHLEESGFLVGAIRPPTVPAHSARLRLTVSCAHTADDIDRLAQAIGEAVNQV